MRVTPVAGTVAELAEEHDAPMRVIKIAIGWQYMSDEEKAPSLARCRARR